MEKLTCSVKELGQMVGISLPRAYDLAAIEGFPVIKMGRRRVVLVEQAKQWLVDNAGKALW